MNARVIQFALVAAAVLSAGIARTHLTAAPSLATRSVAPRASHGQISTGPVKMSSSLDVAVAGDGVQFTVVVTNEGSRRVEVAFPSGQTHDVVVYDAAGNEVWRWSVGQMFTQALQDKSLDANESLHYTMRWRHPALHGPLVAVASLNSTNYPVEARAQFALP
jgi:Intracellular proteinase inhibitor